MKFSKSCGKMGRTLVALLLTLLMLVTLCITVGAAKAGTPTMTTLLTLDPNEMSSTSGSNADFNWAISGNAGFSQSIGNSTGKALLIAPGQFVINDTSKVLSSYEAVSISFDIYFENLPSAKSGSSTSPDPSSDSFKSQSVIAWLGESYDGLRIDSEGNLYSDSTKASALDVKLNAGLWYSLRLVFSQSTDMLELWLDGERVATAPCVHRSTSDFIRFFDATNSYRAHVKNIEISATEDFYYCGLDKEPSADFISYQTTLPSADGSFDLRVITGIDSTEYRNFGYRVLLLTKDGTVKELTGTDTKVYSSIYGGDVSYSIKEHFGYEYAALATIKNLDATLDFTELVIFPYTVSMTGNKIYGTPISLAYTGIKNADGFPTFHVSCESSELIAEADTCLDVARSTTNLGADNQFIVRNTGSYSTSDYRAAYFKFTIPAKTVAELDKMANVYLKVYLGNIQVEDGREKQNICVFGATSNWTEDNTYSDFYNRVALGSTVLSCKEKITGARGNVLDTIAADDYFASSYLIFDVLDYVSTHAKNADGSVTVSFCVTHEDNNGNASVIYLKSREAAGYEPKLVFEKSIYSHAISNQKTNNVGYEPLSYAEKIVNEWFNDVVHKVYPKDQSGNLIYHDELDPFAPNGYAATTATGDYKTELPWKQSSPWSTEADNNYIAADSEWSTSKFARTLSTLGTSTANAYLSSSYATEKAQYDVYGGITNAGFTGTATGFFHTEKHTDGRTYVIDPLGNPYFAMAVNQFNLGDSGNHKTYSLAKFETEDAYFDTVTASLKGIGINTAFVSDDSSILDVENGLNVVVGVTGVGSYMAKLGRSQVKEGVYPHNNTINVFDPDFAKLVNQRNAELITSGGYADNKNVFAYSSDNELPAGVTILERYLTIDPSVLENAFSYHTAWTWLARRMNMLNPSLDAYRASDEKEQMNSEFLSFLYTTYYTTIRKSIEAVDTNHMYLGSRAFDTCKTDEGFLRAAGYCLDIITLNLYDGLNPSATTISNIYKYSGKPFIVTEFFAKGLDAIDANGYKLANSTGAGILVKTQAERAAYYENYVLNLIESKACVGWSWYRFRDNDQSLYTATLNDTTLADLRMLYVMYTDVSYPITLMDSTGKLYTLSELGGAQHTWKNVLTTTYSGEGIASNQNVNKGIFNSDFSTTVTVTDSTLGAYDFGTVSYEVLKVNGSEDFDTDDFVNGATLTVKLAGYDLATDKTGLTKTITFDNHTKLTTFEGKYLELSSSIKSISENIMGLVKYFDAN